MRSRAERRKGMAWSVPVLLGALSLAMAMVLIGGSLLTSDMPGMEGGFEVQEVVERFPAKSWTISGRPVVALEDGNMDEVKGILVLLPGCHHSALDFWPPGGGCESCVGLPAEIELMRTAVSEGMLPLAISASASCWNFTPGHLDMNRIQLAIEEIVSERSLQNTPLYVFGASSGGMAAVITPQILKVDGIIVQIAAAPESKFLQNNSSITGVYPPTAFIHMPRDRRTSNIIYGDVKALEKQGTPVAEFKLEKKLITEDFFSSQIVGMSSEESERIYTALKEDGLINADGYFRDDPRRIEWRSTLHERIPDIASRDGLIADASPISELLNIAYAGHEFSAEHISSALQFLMKHTSQHR